MFCRNCHHASPDQASYCRMCGAALPENASEASEVEWGENIFFPRNGWVILFLVFVLGFLLMTALR